MKAQEREREREIIPIARNVPAIGIFANYDNKNTEVITSVSSMVVMALRLRMSDTLRYAPLSAGVPKLAMNMEFKRFCDCFTHDCVSHVGPLPLPPLQI